MTCPYFFCLLFIFERIDSVVAAKGIQTFHTGVTTSTGRTDAFVASVGMLIGDLECQADLNDFGFPFFYKRCVNLDCCIVGRAEGKSSFKSIEKNAATIPIGFVIVFDGGQIQVLDVLSFRPGSSKGNKEHVAIGHDGVDLLFIGSGRDARGLVGERIPADLLKVEL